MANHRGHRAVLVLVTMASIWLGASPVDAGTHGPCTTYGPATPPGGFFQECGYNYVTDNVGGAFQPARSSFTVVYYNPGSGCSTPLSRNAGLIHSSVTIFLASHLACATGSKSAYNAGGTNYAVTASADPTGCGSNLEVGGYGEYPGGSLCANAWYPI